VEVTVVNYLKGIYLVSLTVSLPTAYIFLFTPYATINVAACVEAYSAVTNLYNSFVEASSVSFHVAPAERLSDHLALKMTAFCEAWGVTHTMTSYWVLTATNMALAVAMSLIILIPLASLSLSF
jgi:predicted Co/Zn/Cd cation transporter (cation efflux family)